MLDRVVERGSDEPLVDLRLVAPSCVIFRPQTIPFVRVRVAEMAERAAQGLPQGVRLAITDAWRPLSRQVRIYTWMTACARQAYPERDEASRRTVNRWAAPPNRKAPPGHCTGAAIDVYLIDDAGEPLDVTSPFDRFGSAPTYSLGLSDTAVKNRALLVQAMLGAGFSNCRDEWWHYSYGDAAWAVRSGLTECIYGLATLPEELYAEQERISEEFLRCRPNPFLEPTPVR